MRLTRKIFLFLSLVFCAVVECQPLKISTTAQSALLINSENGAILYKKNPDTPLFPASISKIATALFLLEKKKVNLTEEVIVSADAIVSLLASKKQAAIESYPSYLLEHDGKTLGLLRGERVSVEMLLKGLLIHSANDAANILAEHASGKVEHFMQELNAYLKEIGCVHTHLTNPHGLYHPKQVTTATEMAHLATLALKNPTFREIVATPSFELITSRKTEDVPFYHSNRLLRKGTYQYPAAIGIKTGHIESIGFNIVAAAEQEGRQLIAVLIGCKKRGDNFKEAAALFNAAFKEKKQTRTLFSEVHDFFAFKIPHCRKKLQAGLSSDVTLQYYPAEEKSLHAEIHWDKISLPISKGQRVAELRLLDDRDVVYCSYSLFAQSALQEDLMFKILAKWPWILVGLICICFALWRFQTVAKKSKLLE